MNSQPQHPVREPQPGAGLPLAPSHFLAAPEGYFNNLDASIQARIQGEIAPASPLQNPILRRDWLAAPDGYFASLPSRIVTRVQRLRSRLLPDLSNLLAPQNLRLALPLLLVGLMIGGGWFASQNQAYTATALATRGLAREIAREELLTAINHELDGFDDALLAEHLLPPPAQSARVQASADTAVEEYLAQHAETSEILAEAALMTP